MTADMPEDFVDVLRCLRAEACDFVIVGAHALAVHGFPRATGDLDILVRPDTSNADKVMRALTNFGAPLRCSPTSARAAVRRISPTSKCSSG